MKKIICTHFKDGYMVKGKFIAIGMVLLMIFSIFTCCSANKFNTILYSQANEWIDETFLKDNRVTAYYPNESYVEGKSDPSDKYIKDKTSPYSRVFIITEEDEYRKIFSKSQMEIDFEKETVILYIFSDVNPNRKYILKKIEVNDKILTVQVELERKNGDDATMPYQRCFMIKMNKVEINEVRFE